MLQRTNYEGFELDTILASIEPELRSGLDLTTTDDRWRIHICVQVQPTSEKARLEINLNKVSLTSLSTGKIAPPNSFSVSEKEFQNLINRMKLEIQKRIPLSAPQRRNEGHIHLHFFIRRKQMKIRYTLDKDLLNTV